MTDYQIQASSRRCASTDRELQPGERYYSVLLVEGGSLIRKDYSLEAWQGVPEGAYSYWQGRLPTQQTNRRPPIDDDMLLECFCRLIPQEDSTGDSSDEGKESFRYVLALLLMRRKKLRLEDTRKEKNREVMLLRCARTGERYQVIDPGLSDDQLETVQDDVFRVLGWQ